MVELLGSHLGDHPDILVIYLCMNFGWNGAPGQWMSWGWALKQYTEAHRPRVAEESDPSPFRILVLMDDAVFV